MKKVVAFLKEWHEMLSIPFIFILFYLSPVLLRWIDPTAGDYDIGRISKVIFAITAFLIINLAVWLILKIEHPRLYRQDEAKDYEELNTWQKLLIRYFYYLAYLLALILLVIVL